MKLIAYDVSNLTDARYFAARGAHMIGFSTSLSSIEQVNAMKDWVDVPDFFLHLPDFPSAEFVWEWQERTGINQFLVSSIAPDVINLFPNATWISFLSSEQQKQDLDISFVFIQAENLSLWHTSASDLSEVSAYVEFNAKDKINFDAMGRFTGVIIKGSGEDKVGVKSYDAIDDFLDSIEIDY